VRIVERVVDVAALLAVPNEPSRAEQAQVVRTGGLRQAGDGSEIADAQLAGLEQRRDESHAAWIGENAEGFGQILEDALVRQMLEDGGDPLRFDTLDLAPVKRDNTSS